MEPRVIPLLIPQVDFNSLLRESSLLLDRSPSKKLDSARVEVKTLKGYLQILQQIESEDSEAELETASFVLNQISFSFMIIAPLGTMTELSKYLRSIRYASNNVFGIVHGTLGEYYDASMRICRDEPIKNEVIRNLRKVICQIVLLLEQAGFRCVWTLRKKNIEPGIFIFETY